MRVMVIGNGSREHAINPTVIPAKAGIQRLAWVAQTIRGSTAQCA